MEHKSLAHTHSNKSGIGFYHQPFFPLGVYSRFRLQVSFRFVSAKTEFCPWFCFISVFFFGSFCLVAMIFLPNSEIYETAQFIRWCLIKKHQTSPFATTLLLNNNKKNLSKKDQKLVCMCRQLRIIERNNGNRKKRKCINNQQILLFDGSGLNLCVGINFTIFLFHHCLPSSFWAATKPSK